MSNAPRSVHLDRSPSRNSGVAGLTPEFFQGVRRLCDERGILFMVDEVQTGIGRTGKWFGFQHFGVMPDVVTMAKALGNGMPIGACWARADVAASFQPGDHATTYGGQPLATSAARAVLDTMVAIDGAQLAADVGARLRTALLESPVVDDVRGLGLLMAVELRGADARLVSAELLKRGLVTNGVTPTALRLAPPFVITDAHIAEAVALITEVTTELANSGDNGAN